MALDNASSRCTRCAGSADGSGTSHQYACTFGGLLLLVATLVVDRLRKPDPQERDFCFGELATVVAPLLLLLLLLLL
jgi:hypothetical protein